MWLASLCILPAVSCQYGVCSGLALDHIMVATASPKLRPMRDWSNGRHGYGESALKD